MDDTARGVIGIILDGIKQDSYNEDYSASDEEAMGLLVSKFFQWDGLAIMRTAIEALEDANFHAEAAGISDMLDRSMGVAA